MAKGYQIHLEDGTTHTVSEDWVTQVCFCCGTEYAEGEPFAGYCDETMSCAMSDGDSLITVPRW